MVLSTYTAERVPVVGSLLVHVEYNGQEKDISLIVVESNGLALLGRDWVGNLRLNWKMIAYHNHGSAGLEKVLQSYAEVFTDELGTVQDTTVSLVMKEGSQPKFFVLVWCHSQSKGAIETEIDHLEQAGILEKVETSRWATPVVPVPKKDGTLQLCGDYKVTINPILEVDQYPLPKPEEIFALLSGGRMFSKLDLLLAYQQLQLDKAAKEQVTINTHKSLYCYTHLPFGVASAPAIFQHMMDSLLQGLPNVSCYLDDIIVTSATDEEHLSTLWTVLDQVLLFQASGEVPWACCGCSRFAYHTNQAHCNSGGPDSEGTVRTSFLSWTPQQLWEVHPQPLYNTASPESAPP